MKKIRILVLLIVLLVTAPYFLAWLSEGDKIFSGLLFNPVDGFSYLAKMRQGWEGSWKFFLPYSADQGEGAYLFTYYILLGHIARLLNLSLPLVFNAGRIAGAVFLMWSLQRLLRLTFHCDEEQVFRTMLLACLDSGLGWIGLIFGKMTPDFWLAEAYPFLSMFANPHFPLGIGLMLVIFSSTGKSIGWKDILILSMLGLILSAVLPFGFVIVALVITVLFIGEIIKKRKTENTIIVLTMIPGGFWLIYQYAAIIGDPILAAWNEQNITATPSFMELFIAFLPVILASIGGMAVIIRRRQISGGKIVFVWILCCAVLVLLPFGLQRRFLTGIYIPLAILAMIGIEALPEGWRLKKRQLFTTVVILAIPTSMLTLFIFTNAGLHKEESIFLSKGEAEAFTWLEQNLTGEPLCLTDEKTGLLLPAYSLCRVLYGHPFESADASIAQKLVAGFFDPGASEEDNQKFIHDKKIEFLVIDKEREKNRPVIDKGGFTQVFENGSVQIWQVDP